MGNTACRPRNCVQPTTTIIITEVLSAGSRRSDFSPFVPILRGGAEGSVVQRALQQLRISEELNQLEPLLAFFASFVLEIPSIQQIMRWDMTVLRESPWYQEILTQGLQQGVQQGA